MTKPTSIDHDSELRKRLRTLLSGGQSHAHFDDVVRDLPLNLQGTVVKELPYTAWQLLEHIRIAQRDMLDFCSNADGHYKKLKWPKEYWPEDPAPPDAQAWGKSVQHYRSDLAALQRLVASEDLYAPFPWGEGQNLLHEAFLVVDHTSYHLGELIAVRRMLGAWKSAH